MDGSKCRDRRLYYRNSRLKGLISFGAPLFIFGRIKVTEWKLSQSIYCLYSHNIVTSLVSLLFYNICCCFFVLFCFFVVFCFFFCTFLLLLFSFIYLFWNFHLKAFLHRKVLYPDCMPSYCPLSWLMSVISSLSARRWVSFKLIDCPDRNLTEVGKYLILCPRPGPPQIKLWLSFALATRVYTFCHKPHLFHVF